MLVPLTNSPRNYAWGSRSAMAEALGRVPSGEPEAELWLGAHDGSPAVITDPLLVGGARTLDEWIATDPQTTLGSYAEAGHLPFLLKILAAASPLSLQAHPSPQRALRGFERENLLGIPMDAAHRNYKDPHHKPEMIYALSDTFEVLCGFRALDEVQELFATIADDDTREALAPLREKCARGLKVAVEWLLRSDVTSVVDAVVGVARGAEKPSSPHARGAYERELATVRLLAEVYPGDPGIVLSLFLNRVSMRCGDALYLPAGNIHAYLEGLGVEVMASSDNVLRGGLTPKHVDVDELLDVLEFRALPVPFLCPFRPHEGLEVYRPDVPDFALMRVTVGDGVGRVPVSLGGPAIAICLGGAASIVGAYGSRSVSVGESIFVTPDEGSITVEAVGEGSGLVFIATTNM